VTTRAAALDKAAILAEALPWIRAYRGARVVVKVGGAPLDDPAHASLVAADLALLNMVGIELVVVHGGGPQVSVAMERAGLEARFAGGLRVTDDDAIGIVRQVLVGTINPDLVARLNSAGLRAVGLSGVDDGLIRATRTTGPSGEDIGWVGEVSEVSDRLLSSLLQDGYTPVLASIAVDAGGDALNVNADAVAGAVAAAIDASKLVYLTNVEGLYADLGDSGSLLSELKATELSAMLPSLSTGMRPKMASALAALNGGVGKVHVLDGRIPHALLLEIFTDEGIGTQVLP
jgi:acetylglutamate kinase